MADGPFRDPKGQSYPHPKYFKSAQYVIGYTVQIATENDQLLMQWVTLTVVFQT